MLPILQPRKYIVINIISIFELKPVGRNAVGYMEHHGSGSVKAGMIRIYISRDREPIRHYTDVANRNRTLMAVYYRDRVYTGIQSGKISSRKSSLII